MEFARSGATVIPIDNRIIRLGVINNAGASVIDANSTTAAAHSGVKCNFMFQESLERRTDRDALFSFQSKLMTLETLSSQIFASCFPPSKSDTKKLDLESLFDSTSPTGAGAENLLPQER